MSETAPICTLNVDVAATVTSGNVSFQPGSFGDWSIGQNGGIHPPTGSGSGSFGFSFVNLGSHTASFSGFAVKEGKDGHFSSGSWAPKADLVSANLSPGSSPWPPQQNPSSLSFDLTYGKPAKNPDCHYKLTVTIDGTSYSLDPKIYNDPEEVKPKTS